MVQVQFQERGLQTHRQGHVRRPICRRTPTFPSYLRATVTYTDPEGEDKTAKMESDFTVQGVRGSNMAPEFAADQDPNMTEDPGLRQRGLWRRTQEAGSTVGDPVTADPKDGDVLTYTLWDVGGTTQTDASANFDIDGATGQIMTKVKSALDCGGRRHKGGW